VPLCLVVDGKIDQETQFDSLLCLIEIQCKALSVRSSELPLFYRPDITCRVVTTSLSCVVSEISVYETACDIEYPSFIRHLKLQTTCTFRFMCKHSIVRAIFPEVGVRKVSNSKSDFQGHSRSLALAPLDRPHTISYWPSICSYIYPVVPFRICSQSFPET